MDPFPCAPPEPPHQPLASAEQPAVHLGPTPDGPRWLRCPVTGGRGVGVRVRGRWGGGGGTLSETHGGAAPWGSCSACRSPEQVGGLGLAASGGQAPGRPAEGGPAPTALFSHGAKGCGHRVTKGPLLVTEQLPRASRAPPPPREPGGGPMGALCACGAAVCTPSPTTRWTLLQAPALLPAVALNFSSRICKQEA